MISSLDLGLKEIVAIDIGGVALRKWIVNARAASIPLGVAGAKVLIVYRDEILANKTV